MFSSMLSLLGSLRGGATSFITNSLRFRSNASAYLSRTFVTPTNSTVFTWSGWVKRGSITGTFRLFGASTNTSFGFNSSDQLSLTLNGVAAVTTTAVYRDPSAWYHIIYAQNGAAQTIYVNGSSVGTGTTANTVFNTVIAHQLGAANTTNYFDGYLTEVHFIDGQALTPASFGAINSSTGVWAPSPYGGTYGANGFYLKFADASAATAAAIGKDSSGNGNNWTPNNISVTAGATYDSMIDVPVNYSDGGNGRGNYCTLSAVDRYSSTVNPSDGNLAIVNSSAGSYQSIRSTVAMTTGKWYCEGVITASGSLASARTGAALYTASDALNTYGGVSATSWAYFSDGRAVNNSISTTLTSGSLALNDIFQIAFDADTGNLWFGKNGTWLNGGNPATGANPIYSGIAAGTYFIGGWAYSTADKTALNFGQRPFQNTTAWATLQAAGFRALNTNNLPTPSIVNGANFMAATTYTGTAGVQSILNTVNSVSFQPDLVWIKSRTPGATSHALFDSVRGTTKYLSSDTTTAETTLAGSLTAFNANGFSLGTATAPVNTSANSYIAWQWKAGGAAVSNTQGTITSQVSANTTAGFSVVTYTGTGANATVGHGLGVAPKMVIVKARNPAGAFAWVVWHTALAGSEYLSLDTASAKGTLATLWNSAVPTSSVFNIGTDQTANETGKSNVAYCFAEIAGFSRFGSYTGNGLADGPFVFCGFRPRFVMVKAAVGGIGSWTMLDTSRDVFNLMDNPLFADLPDTETLNAPNYNLDGLSNGFKLRTTGTGVNASGVTFIFAAFAEVPSKYALAR